MSDLKSKAEHLHALGSFNRSAKKVKDSLFLSEAFFDPEDLVQVKYEMVRRVIKDGLPIAQAADQFGFSRPSFYAAQQALEDHGVLGLIPRKSGPQGGHKLSEEVMVFVRYLLQEDSTRNSQTLIELIQAKFGIKVHQRTIERALARSMDSKKKPKNK